MSVDKALPRALYDFERLDCAVIFRGGGSEELPLRVSYPGGLEESLDDLLARLGLDDGARSAIFAVLVKNAAQHEDRWRRQVGAGLETVRPATILAVLRHCPQRRKPGLLQALVPGEFLRTVAALAEPAVVGHRIGLSGSGIDWDAVMAYLGGSDVGLFSKEVDALWYDGAVALHRSGRSPQEVMKFWRARLRWAPKEQPNKLFAPLAQEILVREICWLLQARESDKNRLRIMDRELDGAHALVQLLTSEERGQLSSVVLRRLEQTLAQGYYGAAAFVLETFGRWLHLCEERCGDFTGKMQECLLKAVPLAAAECRYGIATALATLAGNADQAGQLSEKAKALQQPIGLDLSPPPYWA